MVLPAHKMPRLKTKFLRSTLKFFLTIVAITWVFQHTVVRNDSSRSWMKFSDQNCNIQQGCQSGKPGLVNVHLVPHLYHGSVTNGRPTTDAHIGLILHKDSSENVVQRVVDELLNDSLKRFVISGVAFFASWWSKQSTWTQGTVRDLVSDGRLEFVDGSWSDYDRDMIHYVDIVDSTTLGLSFIKENFGECAYPSTSAQLHSFEKRSFVEQDYLKFQMGYDFDFQSQKGKSKPRGNNTAKPKISNPVPVWTKDIDPTINGKNKVETASQVFHALHGFCLENSCGDPISNVSGSKEFNIDKRVKELLAYCEHLSGDPKSTNDIIIFMGTGGSCSCGNRQHFISFYRNANNIEGSRFNFFYSTPTCYSNAIKNIHRTWPKSSHSTVKENLDQDAIHNNDHYSSNPSLQFMIRQASNLLQSCKQMASILVLKGKSRSVSSAKEAVGLAQQFPISGTHWQETAPNIAASLHAAVKKCQKTQSSYYREELPISQSYLPQVSFCQLNESSCALTEQSERFVVNVYNSLSRPLDKYVRFPVTNNISSFLVYDAKGNFVPSQLLPVGKLFQTLQGWEANSTREIVFLAKALPPVGFKSFYIEAESSDIPSQLTEPVLFMSVEDETISNEKIKITVDAQTGLVKLIEANGERMEINQQFMWQPTGQSQSIEPTPVLPLYSQMGATIYKGALVHEIHQHFNDWIGQVIRIYKGEDHIEFNWVVGSIPIGNDGGNEIISRFSTNLRHQEVFYTDSNGRNTLERHMNCGHANGSAEFRSFYPVNSHMYLKCPIHGEQLTILVDRPQGGRTLCDGQMDLAIYSRVAETKKLDQDYVDPFVSGTHYMMITGKTDSFRKMRSLGQEVFHQPQISFVAADFSSARWPLFLKKQETFISRALPTNINLMTFEPYGLDDDDLSFLLRLEHIFEIGEDEKLSIPETISIKDLFRGFAVTSIREFFRVPPSVEASNKLEEESQTGLIRLEPMQIRTLIVTLVSLSNNEIHHSDNSK